MEIVEFNALMDCVSGIGRTEHLAEETMQIIQEALTQIQTEHLAIMAGISALTIIGITVLINQRKIKKQLKKLLEEKDKP